MAAHHTRGTIYPIVLGTVAERSDQLAGGKSGGLYCPRGASSGIKSTEYFGELIS